MQTYTSLRGRRKQGWGREKKRERENPLSNPPPFFPSPTRFDASYAGLNLYVCSFQRHVNNSKWVFHNNLHLYLANIA